MKVLAINCGSSTLKFDLLDVGDAARDRTPARLAHGLVDRIGANGNLAFEANNGRSRAERAQIADHGEATRTVLAWLGSEGFLGPGGIDAVGHRVVHGGERFVQPAVIDDAVFSAIEELTELAPLHNRPALGSIAAARDVLGAELPMVATFDTAFHRSMPPRASQYAIPPDLADRYQVHRYGFHGLAHRFMVERFSIASGRPLSTTRIITFQLGNGCSAAAVEGGRSVDTSMGLTPLEGLIMGTRSGDVDPSLAGFLAQKEGVDVQEIESLLNRRSGLLGVSGRSPDMRELLAAEASGDERAGLAVEMFCYRVRKYLGAYLAVLGGADAILFGGGIGENAPTIRDRICSGMGWCGLILDAERNRAIQGSDTRISAEHSTVSAYVIRVDEAAVIARDTASCVATLSEGSTQSASA